MALEPLSSEQQSNLINTQLGGSEFFEHLYAFIEIRTKHDIVYREAFPTPQVYTFDGMNPLNPISLIE